MTTSNIVSLLASPRGEFPAGLDEEAPCMVCLMLRRRACTVHAHAYCSGDFQAHRLQVNEITTHQVTPLTLTIRAAVCRLRWELHRTVTSHLYRSAQCIKAGDYAVCSRCDSLLAFVFSVPGICLTCAVHAVVIRSTDTPDALTRRPFPASILSDNPPRFCFLKMHRQ